MIENIGTAFDNNFDFDNWLKIQNFIIVTKTDFETLYSYKLDFNDEFIYVKTSSGIKIFSLLFSELNLNTLKRFDKYEHNFNFIYPGNNVFANDLFKHLILYFSKIDPNNDVEPF